MHIDFETLERMIPEGGELVLKLTRKKNTLKLMYHRRPKAGEAAPPLILEGSAADLTEGFERVVSEIVPLERMIDNKAAIEKQKKTLTDKAKGDKQDSGKGKADEKEEDGGLFGGKGGKKK